MSQGSPAPLRAGLAALNLVSLSDDAKIGGSAIKSPRSPGSPKGSVRFAGGADSTGIKTPTPGKTAALAPALSASTAPVPYDASPVVSRVLKPTKKVLDERMDAVHRALLACNDLAPNTQVEASKLLLVAHRALMSAKEAAAPAAAGSETRRRSGVDPASVDMAASLGSPSAVRSTSPQRHAAWSKFCKAVKGKLSSDEAELLSLGTVKSLAHHLSLDRDSVFMADLELHWRNIAQDREDRRNGKAVMHKHCSGANVPAAARQLSKTMDSPRHLRKAPSVTSS